MFKSLIVALTLSTSAIAADAFLPKSMSADFNQITKSIVTGKEQVSLGSIEYVYPSNLRLEITKPDPLLLVSNSAKTWFYRPPFIEGEKPEITVKNSGDTELAKFFAILKNGLTSNIYYTVQNNGANVTLTFTKKGTEKVGIVSAELFFAGEKLFKNLDAIKVVQGAKKSFTLKFQNLKTDVSLAKERFSLNLETLQ